MPYASRNSGFQTGKLLREPAYLLLSLALLILVHAPRIYDSDEGVVLNGAWNLFNGRKLYTDFFEFVPPGTFYLVYGTWLVTGPYYWGAQLIGIVCLLLSAVGVQLIVTSLLQESDLKVPPWSVRIIPLLFCASSAAWAMISYTTFSLVITIWVSFFVLRAIRLQSLQDNVTAGFLTGLSFAFLQHRALAVVAGVLCAYCLLWLRHSNSRWLKYGLQFVLAFLIVPTMLLVLFSPAVLFANLYRYPTQHYWYVNWVNPAPLVVALATIALIYWYLRKQSNDLIVFLAILQCALFLSLIARPDISHVLVVMYPMLCLLPLVVARFVLNHPGNILNASSEPYWLTVVVFFCSAAVGAFNLSAGGAPRLIAYIRDNCASSPYLYGGPFLPSIYFETGKLNATRYSNLLTGANTDAQFRDAAESLSNKDVPCAVTNYEMVKKFGYSRQNPVDKYIDGNYRVVLEDGGFRVLRKAASAE